MTKRFQVTSGHLFFLLYILISLATFRHSAIGFASLEGSTAWGALSALAVDVLMILFAHSIRQYGFSWSLAFGLTIPALASIYTQLLFAVTEAQSLEIASGALWLGNTAVNITNIRVIGLPALLPILALVAALMGESNKEESVPLVRLEAIQAQLNSSRNEVTRLRREAEESNAAHEQTVQPNKELAKFKAAVTDFAAWETGRSVVRLVDTVIFPNGSQKPETKVLAHLAGVSSAQVSTVRRELRSEQ